MFSYEQAFERNLGWVSESEQQVLRSKRVAIAGLGGVGGAHLLALTRLGIGRFTLADFDHFELHNFNRQVGANVGSIGRPKIDVMAEMALGINPELDLVRFEQGVDHGNAEAFLDGADLYIDGLDFFVLDVRQRIFNLCAERGIPAITAAPLGHGRGAAGISPGRNDVRAVLPDGVDLARREGREIPGGAVALDAADGLPRGSVASSTLLPGRGRRRRWRASSAPGIAAAEALKVLLGRGRVRAAPWGLHFDAYKNRLKRTWRPGGNAHPLQRALIALTRRRYAAKLSGNGEI